MRTEDDDFLDIDYLKSGHQKVAVLCHGLEGSSQSQYIQGTAQLLHANGYDIAAINYRGCSGEMNEQVRSYHSGATDDLHLVIQTLLPAYDNMALVGFSLGGNMVLKYSCDLVYRLDPKINSIVAVSVPIDLHGASMELLKFSNILYTKNFLGTLIKKTKLKHQQHPESINIDDVSKVKTVYDFDEYFTSRIHGFESADDYYAKCNSKQFLTNCQRRTLIINAQDDPFLSESCFPNDEASVSELLHLLAPLHGGHVGFADFNSDSYWNERQILNFLNGSDE